MLIEFSVTNFLSFKEKKTFSMLASADKSLSDNYMTVGNNNILTTSAIYGANASGKTNLFKILGIITSLIRQSNFLAPNVFLPITPFKLDKHTINKPSEFEIIFIANNIKYLYGFKADNKKIYEEYLTYYPKGRPVNIFKRFNVNEYSFNHEDEKILNDIKLKNTDNKFFISTATSWNFEKTKPAYHFLTTTINVIMSLDQINNYSYSMYSNDKDDSLRDFALRFLEKADFNISGYEVLEKKMTDEKLKNIPDPLKQLIPIDMPIYNVSTKHIVDGNQFMFNLSEESLGTQTIFSFIPIIKDVLDNGKILLIDEFDRSLHPFIIRYITEIFSDPSVNKKGAQLIFNTHDTNLLDLDLLRRDQIWFTEKDYKDGSSDIYPLNDFSVRKSENVEKGYLLGRYGAIPFMNNNIDLYK